MQKEQMTRLDNWEKDCLSIGITEGGKPRGCISVPWHHTVSAFNMRTPDLWLAPEDLLDEALMARLQNFEIIGCYCYTPLADYAVLRAFPFLEDIRINGGKAAVDLSFMEGMKNWFMLYIEDAQLEDLSPAFPEDWKSKGLHSYCVAFEGCQVRDIGPMVRQDIRLSELRICQPEGTNEKERWKSVKAGTYRYLEYKEA